MQPEYEIPMLLRFLFGDSAELARRQASPRLLRWCHAYEDWLAERRTTSPTTLHQVDTAWRCFLGQVSKMPWEITSADVEAYSAWMHSRDYSPGTIAQHLGYLVAFYRWCSLGCIDPETPPGFNPAWRVRRPPDRRYQVGSLLSRQEVDRLLGYMQQDLSPLGRRDYAFMLARLRLGVTLGKLQKLTWGQIEHDGTAAWVRWHPHSQPCPLPADVYAAILAYLHTSARLPPPNPNDEASAPRPAGEASDPLSAGDHTDSIQPSHYIFAPLADKTRLEAGSHPDDWHATRYITTPILRRCLKLYGRPAGIPEHKLNLRALRLTALRLRLDQGATLDEMQLFMDSQESTRSTRFRLKRLPQLPPDAPPDAQPDDLPGLPSRSMTPFQPTHGFYAHSQPPQVVEDMLRQDIRGIDEEFAALRILGRGLLERQQRATSSREMADLSQAYTLLAYRLAELVRAEKELQEQDQENRQADELMDRWEEGSRELGHPLPEGWREEIIWGDPEQAEASRHLVEEVAGLRHVIRNAFRLAMESQETKDYIRMVDVYGSACIRLVKLLRSQGSYAGRVWAYAGQMIDLALQQVIQEWNLGV